MAPTFHIMTPSGPSSYSLATVAAKIFSPEDFARRSAAATPPAVSTSASSNPSPTTGQNQARWFTEQVLPHGPALRAFLRARYPSLPDVDDLVQESLVRVLRTHEREPVISPRGLLFATARNLALDQMRRHQIIAFEPITEIADSSVFTDSTNVAETIGQKQEFDLLTQAIQSLPDRCRQVVTLRAAYGLAQREIAEKLGISENTVEKQMAKGMRRCTEFFARLGLP